VETVMRWVVDLTATNVAAKNLRPYLSALNSWHTDLDLPPPALGPAITSVKRGIENLQAAEGFKMDASLIRAPLPSVVISEWLDYALGMDPATNPKLFRALVAMVVAYSWFARSGANYLLQDDDVRIDSLGVTIVSMKSKGKNNKADPPRCIPYGAIPGYQELLVKWVNFRGPSSRFFLFQSDRVRHSNPSDTWLSLAFTIGSHRPPPGKKWKTHSLRGGASSAAHAVRVSSQTINWWGGWTPNSQAPALFYIDPSVFACDHARQFFHWLARP
jgi:hypothetical protein